MDTLINFAVESLSGSQERVPKTGGEEYDHNRGSQGDNGIQIDHTRATQIAHQHTSSGGNGNAGLFTQALSFVGTAEKHTPVDEEHLTKSHEKAYAHDQASSLDAHSLGSAAAVQVLKKFVPGSGSGDHGGDIQSMLMGQAMAEGLKLFESSGAQGNKQDAVNGAAMTMMKLLVQSKFSGGGIMGGSSSGSLSTLMGLAKFV